MWWILGIIGVIYLIWLISVGVKHAEEATARYEKLQAGEFSEQELNPQEKKLLQKLKQEKNCNNMNDTDLLFWAFMMHNHNVLPRTVVEPYEVELKTAYPAVYETYQQCYNNYCTYNSGGSYSSYNNYSSNSY